MAKASVYVDTTVPSAYYDERTPDRQRLTHDFWEVRLDNFDAVISSIVLFEIRNTPNVQRRATMERLVKDFRVLEFDVEADALAQEYICAVECFPKSMRRMQIT